MITANSLWKVYNFNVLKKWGGFSKTKCFHSLSSALTKNKQKKTINTAFISSQVCLKYRVSDFWNVTPFHFYKLAYLKDSNAAAHSVDSDIFLLTEWFIYVGVARLNINL